MLDLNRPTVLPMDHALRISSEATARSANPAVLASCIRAFITTSGKPQLAAIMRLITMASVSIPDSLTIVSAEGLLERIERALTSPAEGLPGMQLVVGSLGVLATAVRSADSRACVRVAQEPSLVREVVRQVARAHAEHARTNSDTYMRVMYASLVLEALASHPSLMTRCADALMALSDRELGALVRASALSTAPTIPSLSHCIDHEPFLRRLMGLGGLPLDLAKILADEGSTEPQIHNTGLFLNRLTAAAALSDGRGPWAEWAKPMIKPLRSALSSPERASPERVEHAIALLRVFATDFSLMPSIANGLPDLIATLQRGGGTAASVAGILGSLADHPGARAAALREGAVPALVSLLRGRGEGESIAAFVALGALSTFEDSQAVVRTTTDALTRLSLTIKEAVVPALALRSDRNVLFALNEVSTLLPLRALVDTGAQARVVQLCGSQDTEAAGLAISMLLAWLTRADEPVDVASARDACRIGLHTYGPAGDPSAAARLTVLLQRRVCPSWTRVPHEPQIRVVRPEPEPKPVSAGSRALAELLVAENYWILMMGILVTGEPEDAFSEDLSTTDTINVPFSAARLLHFLDRHAGPAVAARVAAVAPKVVLDLMREAAGRGRWGLPLML